MTRIVTFWPFLELVKGATGATGETETVARTAARSPPPTRAGGQDDGSYTNSLKLARVLPASRSIGRLIGSFAYFLPDLGRGTGLRGEKMVGGCSGATSQVLATILDPSRAIFIDLGADCLSET